MYRAGDYFGLDQLKDLAKTKFFAELSCELLCMSKLQAAHAKLRATTSTALNIINSAALGALGSSSSGLATSYWVQERLNALDGVHGKRRRRSEASETAAIEDNHQPKRLEQWTTVAGNRPGGSSTSAESDDQGFVSSRASEATDDVTHPANFVADEDFPQTLAKLQDTQRRQALASGPGGQESSREASARNRLPLHNRWNASETESSSPGAKGARADQKEAFWTRSLPRFAALTSNTKPRAASCGVEPKAPETGQHETTSRTRWQRSRRVRLGWPSPRAPPPAVPPAAPSKQPQRLSIRKPKPKASSPAVFAHSADRCPSDDTDACAQTPPPPPPPPHEFVEVPGDRPGGSSMSVESDDPPSSEADLLAHVWICPQTALL
ncbi:hypothetical protein IWZ00DRAFT_492489 [Phyllosticta capitalensis]